MSEDAAFPDRHVGDIKLAYADEKVDGIIKFIIGFKTLDERRALYGLARRTLARAETSDLDSITAIAQAAIAECIAAAETESDPELANKLIDAANVFSYNLSADMAECWPEDHTPRSTRHFETGLLAANDCLRWRHQLKKGPWPFSIAWWAKGTHELSLGLAAEAVESFQQEYHHAELVAAGDKKDPGVDFGCLVAQGYLALAQIAAGNAAGEELFAKICTTFQAVKDNSEGEAAEDAQFGLDQIQTMRARLTARGVFP